MSGSRSAFKWGLLVFVLALTLVALTWANYRYTLQSPGGSDFLPYWLGTRLFFTTGQSPYSQEVSETAQGMIYGGPALAGEDQFRFVYPFHTIFVVGPFALVGDFSIARALWMTALEVGILALGLIGLSLSRWRPSVVVFVPLFMFIALWYHSLRPVINGNAAVVVALLIAGGLLAIRAERDMVAGFSLALATFKPHMVVLLIPFILLWSVSRKRWGLFWGFIGSLGLIFVVNSLLMPNWIAQNLEHILSYPGYTLPGTPGAIFGEWLPGIGSYLGWALTTLLAGLLLWEWRGAMGKGFDRFLWAAFLTLTITNLIGVRTSAANYIALLPSLVYVFAIWDQRWGRSGRWLALLCMLILFIGLWWLFLATLQMSYQPMQHPVMFFPLPLFLLAGLYSIRKCYCSA